MITRDNVSIGVAAVAYFRRVDPVKSNVEIEDVSSAISQIAQTTVRNVVGRSLLDQVLTDTETLNTRIKEILDGLTQQWGAYVLLVELKDIELRGSGEPGLRRGRPLALRDQLHRVQPAAAMGSTTRTRTARKASTPVSP